MATDLKTSKQNENNTFKDSATIEQLKQIKVLFQDILSHQGDSVFEVDPGECVYQIFKKAMSGITMINAFIKEHENRKNNNVHN